MNMYYRDPDSDLVWAVVPKNASSTMNGLITKHGWKSITQPNHDLHIFCIVQNPWRRFCKGMAEIAWLENERSFEQVRKGPFFKMAFMNQHLLPISVQYPDTFDLLYAIPMDAPGHDVNDLLNDLFEQHGSNTRITPRDIMHKSNSRKLAYQTKVQEWLDTDYPYRKEVRQLYQDDFELWEWSHAAIQPPAQVEPTWIQKFLKRILTSE